jgi:hypothetical protein
VAFTVQIQQDTKQLAYLARIAAASERGSVAAERLAAGVEAAVPFLQRGADAVERAAAALDKLTQPQPEGGLVREVTYRFKDRLIQVTGGTVMLTVKATEVPGTVDVGFKFKDAEGNVADVDSVSGLVASDTSIVDSIEVAADGKGAKLHIGNTVGATQLTLSVIENGESKDYVDTLSVIAGDAVEAEFVFGAVVPDAAPSASRKR